MAMCLLLTVLQFVSFTHGLILTTCRACGEHVSPQRLSNNIKKDMEDGRVRCYLKNMLLAGKKLWTDFKSELSTYVSVYKTLGGT